jgi:tRNA(Leu) C34 or U34 (ribose-2'-O)-methylase TrmL
MEGNAIVSNNGNIIQLCLHSEDKEIKLFQPDIFLNTGILLKFPIIICWPFLNKSIIPDFK